MNVGKISLFELDKDILLVSDQNTAPGIGVLFTTTEKNMVLQNCKAHLNCWHWLVGLNFIEQQAYIRSYNDAVCLVYACTGMPFDFSENTALPVGEQMFIIIFHDYNIIFRFCISFIYDMILRAD